MQDSVSEARDSIQVEKVRVHMHMCERKGTTVGFSAAVNARRGRSHRAAGSFSSRWPHTPTTWNNLKSCLNPCIHPKVWFFLGIYLKATFGCKSVCAALLRDVTHSDVRLCQRGGLSLPRFNGTEEHEPLGSSCSLHFINLAFRPCHWLSDPAVAGGLGLLRRGC